jgi:20S proteasome alpha/beta subunit
MRTCQLSNLCSFFLTLFLSAQPVAIGRVFDTFFSLAVSKGTRTRPSGDAVVEFDEFGGIPQLKNTYMAVAKASVIVAIRSVNATILSYTAKNSSSLQVPVGAQSLNGFIDPSQYMLITGLAGDARTVIRHAKQVALNYTVAFDTAPTGRFIAHEVGKFLQEHTVRSGMRPLACHLFIADSAKEKSLYEVDAAGNIAQIWAGVAGGNMAAGRNILQDHLNGTAISNVEEAKNIADQIFLAHSIAREKLLEGLRNDNDEITGPPSRNADTYHTVHFVLHDSK